MAKALHWFIQGVVLPMLYLCAIIVALHVVAFVVIMITYEFVIAARWVIEYMNK